MPASLKDAKILLGKSGQAQGNGLFQGYSWQKIAGSTKYS
jgi:hypothetical protein